MRDEAGKKEEEALNRFKEILTKQFGSEIVSVHLFGSKARGDTLEESDIDILVVTERDDWRLKEQVGKVATTILLDYGVYLSVKVLGKSFRQRLIHLDSPFLRNILREGILL
ncbi:MAG: hypothetical protein A3G87_09525 [Omnitrophica bacterium RIFCSPLOWO2_12_FULL_50_11]|nr:MAG: hypothetical protein A3G87_09525 [Omnitrophica bacterium RIFCSPLOWO2_12_FULL_50_11]